MTGESLSSLSVQNASDNSPTTGQLEAAVLIKPFHKVALPLPRQADGFYRHMKTRADSFELYLIKWSIQNGSDR